MSDSNGTSTSVAEALAAEVDGLAAASDAVPGHSGGRPPGLRWYEVALLLAGTLGSALAYLVPMVFTLALKLDILDPGNESSLGFIIGVGSMVTLVAAPLTGVLSDRARSRWGRRRPFTVAGTLLGLGATALMATAGDVWTTGLGWVLANLGWGTAMGSIGNMQADRLAPSQRGRVGALTGVVTQVAPVTGILLVGPVASDIALAMWLPVFVGLPMILLFLIFVRDEDSRGFVFAEDLTVGMLLRSYVFRPRAFPDFAWNWVGRFLFFGGITFTSTYSTFFVADRLGMSVQEIAPVVALMSAIGTAVSALGAIGSGWVSDRLGRRRPFVLAAVMLFAGGTAVSAFAYDLAQLIVGGVLASLGVAVFLAINQAMVLDVLPHRETQAGRFMGITAFSQKIPNALAPLAAPALLATGAAGGNYTLLYVCAGALVLAGGLVIVVMVRGVR